MGHQSIGQSINQSVNQPIDRSIIQSTNQSVNEFASHSFSHSYSRSVSQSIIRSVSKQPVNELTNSLENPCIDKFLEVLHLSTLTMEAVTVVFNLLSLVISAASPGFTALGGPSTVGADFKTWLVDPLAFESDLQDHVNYLVSHMDLTDATESRGPGPLP